MSGFQVGLRLTSTFLLLCGALSVTAATTNYRVSAGTSGNNIFHVLATLPVSAGVVQLHAAGSRAGDAGPKSYARLFENVSARLGDEELEVSRLDPWSWSVIAPHQGRLRVEYDVVTDPSDTLQLDGHWISQYGGYFDTTSLVLYTNESRKEAVELSLEVQPNWEIATSIPLVDGVYGATSLDALVDSPVLFGGLKSRSFVANGIPHRLIFSADVPAYDEAAFDANLRKICEYEIQLFGGAPHVSYTALFRWRPDLPYGGGIEHAGSMFMNIGKEWMLNLPVNLSGTFAHEYFHSWNAGALHPRDLAASALDQQRYSRLLWFQEGVTSYYAYLTLTRTGITPPADFYGSLSRDITALESASGRTHMSLSDASVIAGFGSVQDLDYYAGGEVAGFLLDLYIRENSHGAHSLDDVMRQLYRASKLAGYNGYTEDDLCQAVSTQAGKDASGLLHSLVDDKRRFDYNSVLNGAGLTLVGDPNSLRGTNVLTVTPRQDATPNQHELLSKLLKVSK